MATYRFDLVRCRSKLAIRSHTVGMMPEFMVTRIRVWRLAASMLSKMLGFSSCPLYLSIKS